MRFQTSILLVAVIALLILGSFSAVLVSVNNGLKSELKETQFTSQKFQEELTSMQADKQKAERDKERLETDAISYLGLNARLQKEKEQFVKALEEGQNILENKEIQLQQERKKQQVLEERFEKEVPEEKRKLVKENQELAAKAHLAEMMLRLEKATHAYNLGVAYTKAKAYDEAIESFLSAIREKPGYAEAYYNLGLLYENTKDNTVKALECYRKYLELKPESQDRQEVESWIRNLQGRASVQPDPLLP